jgi:outer membrane protein OmpA-like peptidoglycan-associated protein
VFPATASIGASAPPQRRSSLLPKLIGIALMLVLLVGVAVVGGLVYVSYKVKQKAHAVSQNLSKLSADKELNELSKGVDGLTKSGSSPDIKGALQGLSTLTKAGSSPGDLKGALAGLAGALGKAVTHSDGLPVLSSSDPVVPCEASVFPAQSKARVPFKPGTVLTTAWGIKYGDVESRNTIDAIDDSTVRTTNVTPEYKNDNGSMVRATTIANRNCNGDYRATDSYMTVNSTRLPRLMHDLTRFRMSDKCFREIKSTGHTSLTYVDIWNVFNGVKLTHQAGTLSRVEPGDVKYPLIVNDQRVELPAIHLRGTMMVPDKDPRPEGQRPKTSAGELFVLDDPADPLVLNWRLKDPLYHDGNFRVEVVKINFPVAKPENVLEKQLTQAKRAVTYGIYFDFNKDTLKPESAPVLKEIADAMTHNPDWKLTVEGHTDNIGGDPYNLDLSKRRAAAVKQALVGEYNIAGDRLLTNGFGASHPVAPNDTLEGRARNRRVELVRQ